MAADSPLRRQADRPAARLRPLRRIPKVLDEEPVLFDPSPGGVGGLVLGGGRAVRDQAGSGHGGPGLTGEQGHLTGGAPVAAAGALGELFAG